MYQRTVYANAETGESGTACPTGPVFIEGTWMATRIELEKEVHVLTVDYRPFKYA